MKIFLKSLLIIFLNGIFLSCDSSDNSNDFDGIKPDFFTYVGIVQDLAYLNTEQYYIQLDKKIDENQIERLVIKLNKISADGSLMNLNSDLPPNKFNSSRDVGIAVSNNNTPLCVSDSSINGNEILTFSEDFSSILIDKVNSNVPGVISQINSIAHLGNDVYVFYDISARELREYNIVTRRTSLIAGHYENLSIEDGIGINVGFKKVTKIYVNNGSIYVVDNGTHLRKLEDTPSGYKINTILDVSEIGTINSMAYDSSTEEFLLSIREVQNQLVLGHLYLFDEQNQSLDTLTSDYSISLDLSDLDSDEEDFIGFGAWGSIEHMNIYDGDLYFIQHNRAIKISNYRSKIY
ncbi:hypothetical protein [Hyunsoonleella ulvae]|uniref:hypothetical protein n=1 Tax=Hyunsoonleella ulvae TaxID=2799948 RepID=UPI00193A1EEB|nr:hypothetical protein [Hyunsoonleella ulvae]